MVFERVDKADDANMLRLNARRGGPSLAGRCSVGAPSQMHVATSTLPTIGPRKRLSVPRTEINTSVDNGEIDSSGAIQEFYSNEPLKMFGPRGLRGLPSWLWSTILHLVVLLVLALLTFSEDVGHRSIVLEVSDAPNSIVLATTDIVLNPIELDENTELETIEVDAMKFDSPDLSYALMDNVPMDIESSIDLSTLDGLESVYASEADGSLAKVGDGSKAKFFGINSYGKKFVFVIDCSGSMKGSRWRRAVNELRQAVNGLEGDQEFLVLLYNTQTKVMLDSDLQSAGMSVATSDNKRRMFYWLKKQIPNGSTFPGPAVYAALKLRPDAIFLLSDGLLKDNTVNWLKEWNAPRSEQGNYDAANVVPMNTISLDDQGEWVMRTIANQNGGVFVSAK
ncbi:MAG: VWA domain-containing protein [Planctomycetaceae bacterium]|nr:VWA domain-containing protein [Planctomycetaceae bacterium]